MFIVRWRDENGAEGQGNPWQDGELAQRYAEYAARLSRGSRRFWVALAPASARSPRPVADVPDYGRIVRPDTLPLFEGRI